MTRRSIALAIVLALLTSHHALAQQRTIYGADGRVIGRESTDSQGTTTIYGNDGRVSGREVTGSNGGTIYGTDGRVTGRTSTDSSGTTTIYGNDGRRIGTIRPQGR